MMPVDFSNVTFETVAELLLSTERPGMPELVQYLRTNTDFAISPASTHHHGSFVGGLVAHSYAVYRALKAIDDSFCIGVQQDSIVVVALLHDLCKANNYVIDHKNQKDEHGVWQKVPFWKYEPKVPLGHGEKSVILAQQFIKMNLDEIMAIRWHMGGWDISDNSGRDISTAQKKYPLVVALQMADLAAVTLINPQNPEVG